MSKYQRELEFIAGAVKEAFDAHGSFCAINEKQSFDLVTDADVKIEEQITAAIRETFPGDPIMGEEHSPGIAVADRTWTVDPIDGTVNMANSIPLFGVQCSMFDGGEPVVSVIYLPLWNELYTAEKGEGAFLNGEKLACRERPADRAIISFGDFSHRRPDDLTDEHRVMFYLSPRVSKIRMFGSAAVDFALLVTQRIDGTMFFTKNQWDIAPGALLTREAGGVVTSFEGDYTLDSRAVVAASCENIARLIKESW